VQHNIREWDLLRDCDINVHSNIYDNLLITSSFVLGCERAIPDFDENGNLLPDVHYCEWEEFVRRFGTNEVRLHLIRGLQMAIEQLQALLLPDNLSKR
jgi:hypothetical protein